MTTQTLDRSAATERSDRVDTLGWGLLFVAIGAVSLLPDTPDDAWLIAAGLAMLGTSAARGWLQLPVRGVTVVVGSAALAAGILLVAGLTTEVGPLVLIVLGVTIIAGAVYRAQRWTSGAPLAHTR